MPWRQGSSMSGSRGLPEVMRRRRLRAHGETRQAASLKGRVHQFMDVKQTLQQQMQALHGTLEAAIRDCPTDALTRKLPGSTINSIGAIYAHTIFGEDGLLNGLVRGGTPVYFAGGWAP